MRRRIEPWYRFVVLVMRPLLMVLTRRVWRGAEHLPREGGFIVVTNHISHADPFTVGHFLYDQGYLPRFLAKDSLFRMPVFGRVVRGTRQIPVYRESASAAEAYVAAVEAVLRGECVVVYPEGTVTRDPGLWPMRGKSGAVRMALETGCPLVPVAHWGAHEILPPYARAPRVLSRRTSTVVVGPPVDLRRLEGEDRSAERLRETTDLVMDTITDLLAGIRREPPPASRWDPRDHRDVPMTGNPKARRRIS